MVSTYRAGRRIKLSPQAWREPGELVPEAHTWYRLDSYLHTGFLVEVEVDQDELRAAIEAFCPQLAEEIASRTGLDGARPAGPHAIPAGRIYPAGQDRPRTRRPAGKPVPDAGG